MFLEIILMKITDDEKSYYIENIVWWEGQINATDLTRHLQISRDSASTILKHYDQQFPDNLTYDASRKARVITKKFKASHNVSRFDAYLKLIQKTANIHIAENIEEVEAPFRNINAALVRPILKAIRKTLCTFSLDIFKLHQL